MLGTVRKNIGLFLLLDNESEAEIRMGCNYALFPMAQEVGTQLFVKPHSNFYFLKSWGTKTFGYNNFKLQNT